MRKDTEIYPAAVHLPGFLTIGEQADVVRTAAAVGGGAGGWYRPRLRSGAPMRLSMACLGRHWNPKRYVYETHRTDFDGAPVQPMPGAFRLLAERIARAAGTELAPDVVILNHYSESGRLGLHRDEDEDADVLQAGDPIVSVSVGDAGRFRMGGTARNDPFKTVRLLSGDAFVFGGPSRLRYHGIDGIDPGTGPDGTRPGPDGSAARLRGRINLTFRRTRR